MATVINSDGNSSAGWAVAIIVLLVVIAGIAFWYFRGHGGASAAPGANINVTLPSGGGTPAPNQ